MVKRLAAMQETWVRSLGREDPLEKEMATASSTLAWKIPWTEEPCRLQSMGSQSRTRLNDFTSLSQLHCDVFFVSGVQPSESIMHIHTPVLSSHCSPIWSITEHRDGFCVLSRKFSLSFGRPLVSDSTRPVDRSTPGLPAPLPRLPKFTSICVMSSTVRVPVSVSPLPLVTPSLVSTS